MQKTEKRYILIQKHLDWYDAEEIYLLTGYSPDETLYTVHKSEDEKFAAVRKSDAIEVGLVVLGGMLYAMSDDEIDFGKDYVHAPDTSLFTGIPFGRISTDKAKEASNNAGFKFIKIIASSNPDLISDGVLPIKNADEVMRGLEGEKSEWSKEYSGRVGSDPKLIPPSYFEHPAVTALPLSEDEGNITIIEAKDKAANSIGYNDWNDLIGNHGKYTIEQTKYSQFATAIEFAMKEYAAQFQKSDEGDKKYTEADRDGFAKYYADHYGDTVLNRRALNP